MRIPNLNIGTSGWSYPWKGLFYPETLKPAEYLGFYAQQFTCTEINSSFYNYPMERTIEKWLAATPPDFKFAPKLNREITHERRFVDVEEPLEKFMSRFRIMGERLGPVLIQIAASFRFQATVAEHFFALLHRSYPGLAFAFEPRHESWFGAESLALLGRYGIALVMASSGQRFPEAPLRTSKLLYCRLHGAEKLYDSSYKDEKLQEYAHLIRDQLKAGRPGWVFFNNTMRGQAIGDARRLEKMLEALW